MARRTLSEPFSFQRISFPIIIIDGSGFGAAGFAEARLSRASSACRLARRAARYFSIASSAAAFFCAVSIVTANHP